jgi:cytochrome c oxidase subunit 3
MPMTIRRGLPLNNDTAAAFQFVDRDQQREAAQLGMWVFLATEVMFFGGLFTAYCCFQGMHAASFASAGGRTDLWLGTANTAVLLLSSLTMALAVRAAKEGQNRRLIAFLLLTMVLGSAFLSFKGLEYTRHIHDHLLPGRTFVCFPPRDAQGAELFFYLYFVMTGLHSLHMLAGIMVLAVIAIRAARGKYSATYHTPVVLAGLYWHFVDVVWLFLFPMFYLIRGH